LNNLIREKGVSTEPPPSDNFSFEITQWKIFDAYQKELFSGEEKPDAKKKKNKNEESLDLG